MSRVNGNGSASSSNYYKHRVILNGWKSFHMTLDFQIPIKPRKYDCVSILTYQSKCVQNFVDFQRCKRVYGEEYKACNYFMRTAQLLCPSSWVCLILIYSNNFHQIEKWEKEVENNMFPYKI